ncbi:MAG: ABC transporter permease [Porcipelethomonas sp.]
MGKIIRFEFDRLFKQRSFYICTIVMAVIVLLTSIMAGSFVEPDKADQLCGWDNVSVFAEMSMFATIFSIFIAIFVCDDFNSGIIKNIYSRGYSRGKVFVGKYISSLFAMVIMYIVVAAFSFILGSAMWGVGDMGDVPSKLIFQLIVLIGYHGLYFAISMMLGKTGGAIAINIVGASLIPMVFKLVDTLLKLKTFKFSDYWLDSFFKAAGDSSSSSGDLAVAVVFTLVYAVIFFIAGYVVNSKKQV